MTDIHPTAVVDAGAQLGDGVVVEAYAIVGAGVVVGAGSRVAAHGQLLAGTMVGEGCVVGHGAVVGGDPQDLGFDRRVATGVGIGDGCVLREHVTVHRSAREGGVTLVGAGNYLMVGVHVGHDCVLGAGNILANFVQLGGFVSVGDRVFRGGGDGASESACG